MGITRILWDDLIETNYEKIYSIKNDLTKHQYYQKIECEFRLNVLSALKDIDSRISDLEEQHSEIINLFQKYLKGE